MALERFSLSLTGKIEERKHPQLVKPTIIQCLDLDKIIRISAG